MRMSTEQIRVLQQALLDAGVPTAEGLTVSGIWDSATQRAASWAIGNIFECDALRFDRIYEAMRAAQILPEGCVVRGSAFIDALGSLTDGHAQELVAASLDGYPRIGIGDEGIE